MKFNLVIKDFYGSKNLWNVNKEELERIINAYDYGESKLFYRGKTLLFNDIKEFQIYESTVKDEDLVKFKEILRKNNLFDIGFSGNYISSYTFDNKFKANRVTDNYLFGEFGYKKSTDSLGGINNEELFPIDLFNNTKTYIETIANQANSSYKYGIYDGSFILCRKLLETLIIECFEKFNFEHKIQNKDGNFFQLSDLIKRFLEEPKWNISRNSKQSIPKIKKIADKCAHNRRFMARKGDIDNVRDDLRYIYEEIILLIDFQKRETIEI